MRKKSDNRQRRMIKASKSYFLLKSFESKLKENNIQTTTLMMQQIQVFLHFTWTEMQHRLQHCYHKQLFLLCDQSVVQKKEKITQIHGYLQLSYCVSLIVINFHNRKKTINEIHYNEVVKKL